MGIRKKESCKKYVWFLLILSTVGMSWATNQTAMEVLKESYGIVNDSSKEVIRKAIEQLQQAFRECDNAELKERINYQIGMLHFMAGDLHPAFEQFSKIAQSSSTSLPVQLFSVNMTAQVARMEGQDRQALDCYSHLIQMLMDSKAKASAMLGGETFWKIYMSSVCAKIDIYTIQQQYPDAENTYLAAIQVLGQESPGTKANDIAGLYDQLSQLYLTTGRLDKYNEAIKAIMEKSPVYYRLPLIKLEAYAIQLLENEKADKIYTNGSFEAPACMIRYIKDEPKQEEKVVLIDSKFQELIKESKTGLSLLLLKYHYAWFLDAIGKKQQSYQFFSQISSTGKSQGNKPGEDEGDYIIEKLVNYSKLQMALQDGEMERYKKGLECLNTLSADPNDRHLVTITDSIRNSLDVLKREVPVNENKK